MIGLAGKGSVLGLYIVAEYTLLTETPSDQVNDRL
jgi:hypothetical protein